MRWLDILAWLAVIGSSVFIAYNIPAALEREAEAREQIRAERCLKHWQPCYCSESERP